ncbi:MAG: hypothetical protein NZ876_16800, partial [Dehalococcoidia bacterium]|nr:hypothetical protein [Dehalococcoidia bacterium]
DDEAPEDAPEGELDDEEDEDGELNLVESGDLSPNESDENRTRSVMGGEDVEGTDESSATSDGEEDE